MSEQTCTFRYEMSGLYCLNETYLDGKFCRFHTLYREAEREPTYTAAQVAALLEKAAEDAKALLVFPKDCVHGEENWYCDACKFAWEKQLMSIPAAVESAIPADAIAALAKVEQEAEAQAYERCAKDCFENKECMSGNLFIQWAAEARAKEKK